MSISFKSFIKVYAAASHGVLSGTAVEKIEKSCLEEVIITDSIYRNGDVSKKIKVLSVATLLAEAIDRIYKDKSISELFV